MSAHRKTSDQQDPLRTLFGQAVLQVPAGLASREAYEAAIADMGWTLKLWDDKPLKDDHYLKPVRVVVETEDNKTKDFILIRSGNTATFGIVKKIDGVPHIMVKQEDKGAGLRVTTMPSGHMDTSDQSIAGAALRELHEESGMSVSDFVGVAASILPVPNNMTNTSTSFIAEIPAERPAPQGWDFIPLADAPAQINHGPSQLTALFACARYNIVPKLDFVPLRNKPQSATPRPRSA